MPEIENAAGSYAVPEDWNAEEVRKLRQVLGISVDQLAKKLKASKSTVHCWETGAHKIGTRFHNRLTRLAGEAASFSAGGDNWCGLKIARMRRLMSCTQALLARELGVAVSTISCWENGRLPVAETYFPRLSDLQRRKLISDSDLTPQNGK